MPEVGDYSAALTMAHSLLPQYDVLRMNALQMQQTQAQTQQIQAETAQRQQAQRDEGAFTQAVGDLGANPSADRLSALALRFPKYASAIQGATKDMTEAHKTQVTSDLTQAHAALGANRLDLAKGIFQRHLDADKAAGKEPDPTDTAVIGMLDSGDPAQIKAARGFILSTLNGVNPDVAKGLVETGQSGTVKGTVVGRAVGHYNDDGVWVTDYRDPEPPQYREVGPGQTLVEVGGGDRASGGAGFVDSNPDRTFDDVQDGLYGKGKDWTGHDRSRVINSDAGGGYVPDSVQTLGQFVAYGKGLNNRGAKSSSAGTYQINGTTMLEFGPKALGPGWATAPFNAETQDRVGAAIFDWAKGQPDPAKALRGRWVSLTPDESAKLVKGDWTQARGLIARKESSGGPGASANAGGGAPGGARVVAVGAPKPGYRLLTPDENRARQLDPNVRYQLGPDGQISALGGQDKSQGQLKPVPASQVKGILENTATIREIDRAIALLQQRPGSVGWTTGMLGDKFTQWNDPKGVPVRAAVGKVGGKIIHDVSGAAVTLSEAPRFQPYVPQVSDAPDVALAKLKQLRALATGQQADLTQAWGPENGYRGVKLPGSGGGAAAAKPAPTRGWGKATVVSR